MKRLTNFHAPNEENMHMLLFKCFSCVEEHPPFIEFYPRLFNSAGKSEGLRYKRA